MGVDSRPTFVVDHDPYVPLYEQCVRNTLVAVFTAIDAVTRHSLPLFASSWVATVLCCLVAYIVLAFNIIQTRLRVMMTLIFFIFLGMFHHRTGRDTKRWPRTTANETTTDPGITCPPQKISHCLGAGCDSKRNSNGLI